MSRPVEKIQCPVAVCQNVPGSWKSRLRPPSMKNNQIPMKKPVSASKNPHNIRGARLSERIPKIREQKRPGLMPPTQVWPGKPPCRNVPSAERFDVSLPHNVPLPARVRFVIGRATRTLLTDRTDNGQGEEGHHEPVVVDVRRFVEEEKCQEDRPAP